MYFCYMSPYSTQYSCCFVIKDVDVELRIVCEQFIQNISESLISPLSAFLAKVNKWNLLGKPCTRPQQLGAAQEMSHNAPFLTRKSTNDNKLELLFYS